MDMKSTIEMAFKIRPSFGKIKTILDYTYKILQLVGVGLMVIAWWQHSFGFVNLGLIIILFAWNLKLSGVVMGLTPEGKAVNMIDDIMDSISKKQMQKGVFEEGEVREEETKKR